jgi:nucleoside-diphosphate-sugar epimerase
MIVAVTGANGFIGREVCRQLSAAGHRTRALVRAPSAALGTLAGVDQCAIGDLARFADWAAALRGAEAVVHLAGYARSREAASLLEVNVNATVRAARAAGDAHFIFISTAKVHGEVSGERPFDEMSALRPGERYAASKASAEEALRALPRLRLTVLRPPLVYGPGVRANFRALLFAIARGIPLPLARVRNRRSLIYVGNFAHAVRHCVEHPQSAGGAYLPADGAATSTPELCREIGRALGRPARLFPFPPALLPRALAASLEIDDAAAQRGLGWRPSFTMEEGLRATAAWYLGH